MTMILLTNNDNDLINSQPTSTATACLDIICLRLCAGLCLTMLMFLAMDSSPDNVALLLVGLQTRDLYFCHHPLLTDSARVYRLSPGHCPGGREEVSPKMLQP